MFKDHVKISQLEIIVIPENGVLRGVDGSLQFPLSSMNILNQIEPAAYAILLFWAFIRGSIVMYYTSFVL